MVQDLGRFTTSQPDATYRKLFKDHRGKTLDAAPNAPPVRSYGSSRPRPGDRGGLSLACSGFEQVIRGQPIGGPVERATCREAGSDEEETKGQSAH